MTNIQRVLGGIVDRAEAGLASRSLPWILIALGAFLRLSRFVHNPSFYFDEAAVGLNILNRSFRGLLEPLMNHQHAPKGFLWLEKLVVTFFGNSEYAFRLFPLICGLLSVFLFYKVASRILQPAGANLALFLFAISEWLVYYSSEVRPYSTDVCVALFILLVGAQFLEAPGLARHTISFGVLGILATWVSFPSVFVLCGIGLAILWTFGRQGEWSHFRKTVVLASLWMLSFAFEYVLFLTSSTSNEGLVATFGGYRSQPFPQLSPGGLIWFPRALHAFLVDPTGFEFAGLAILMFVIGLASFWRTRRMHFWFLVLPWVVAFAAATARKYPFEPRLLLFLVPLALILIGHGMELFWSQLRRMSSLVGMFCCLLLVLHPMIRAAKAVVTPRSREEIRPLMRVLNESFRDGDTLYVYFASWPVFDYYQNHRKVLHVPNVVRGAVVRGPAGRRGPHDHGDLLALRGKSRVWVLVTQAAEDGQHILGALDSIGMRVQTRRTDGAALYLYDFASTGQAPNPN